MKRITFIFLAILFTGCNRINKMMGVSGNAPAASPHQFLIMGQSNSVFFNSNGGTAELDKRLTQYGFYPNQYTDCGVGGTFMDRWVPSGDLYQACMQEVKQNHIIPSVIFFWQGEADADISEALIDAWPQKFESMASDLKKRFPGVIIYYVRLTSNAASYPLWAQMHDVQTNLPQARMLNVDGIWNDSSNPTIQADQAPVNPHYDVVGYQSVADRLACSITGRDE
jgi:Carbohydrate esterase, sialic acid-specific acetylesterase